MPAHSDPVERWVYASALGGLIGGAWLTLGWLGTSPYAPYLAHDATLGGRGLSATAGRLVIFVAAWTVMSIAMMLPSSLPLVTVFHTITGGAWALVSLLVAGYLAIWGAFSVAVLAADAGLHELVERSKWLAERPDLIPAVLLLTAGLFQFSPLKHSCLEKCRSPIGFVIQHWRGGRRAERAFALGVRHGLFCVGCCWALMVIMFAAGAVNLGWMLVLGAIMFVEKAVERGRWITAPVGVLLSVWGLALLTDVPGIPRPF